MRINYNTLVSYHYGYIKYGDAYIIGSLGNQVIEMFGCIKNNKFHGAFKVWYNDGYPYKSCFYTHGKLDGEYKEWYANGQLYAHRVYKNDKLDGVYMIYETSGQMRIYSYYENDKMIKEVI